MYPDCKTTLKSVTGVARFLNLWSWYDFLHRNKNNRKITNNYEAIFTLF